jgi:hypothetical protein
MEWFSTPPCTRLELAEYSDAEKGLVELTGSSRLARVTGGATTLMGAGFIAAALRFARPPIPLLLPLAMGAVGVGVMSLGTSVLSAECSVRATRFSGLDFRWNLGPLSRYRSLRIKTREIEDFEVTRHESPSSDSSSAGGSDGTAAPTVTYRLVVVTKDGRAIAIEEFDTKAQARQRKALLETTLGPYHPRPPEVLDPRRRRKAKVTVSKVVKTVLPPPK